MPPPRLLDCENALIFFLYSLGQNASVVAHKVSQLRHQLYFSTSQKICFLKRGGQSNHLANTYMTVNSSAVKTNK